MPKLEWIVPPPARAPAAGRFACTSCICDVAFQPADDPIRIVHKLGSPAGLPVIRWVCTYSDKVYVLPGGRRRPYYSLAPVFKSIDENTFELDGCDPSAAVTLRMWLTRPQGDCQL